jgi:hypothetical protein
MEHVWKGVCQELSDFMSFPVDSGFTNQTSFLYFVFSTFVSVIFQ